MCMHDDLLDAILMPLFHADKQIGFHISNAFSILALLINLNVSTFNEDLAKKSDLVDLFFPSYYKGRETSCNPLLLRVHR